MEYSSLDCHRFTGLGPTKSKNVFVWPPPGRVSTFFNSIRTHFALHPWAPTRTSIVCGHPLSLDCSGAVQTTYAFYCRLRAIWCAWWDAGVSYTFTDINETTSSRDHHNLTLNEFDIWGWAQSSENMVKMWTSEESHSTYNFTWDILMRERYGWEWRDHNNIYLRRWRVNHIACLKAAVRKCCVWLSARIFNIAPVSVDVNISWIRRRVVGGAQNIYVEGNIHHTQDTVV